MLVSSQEILNQTGIRTVKTLSRWHQRGLIPPPVVATHPSGRGKMGFWPPEVLQRCVLIRRLVADGRSLDDVAKVLHVKEVAAASAKRRYRFKDVSEKMDYERSVMTLLELVSRKICESAAFRGSVDPAFLRRVDFALSRKETIAKLLELTKQGCNPVLLCAGDSIRVVADFVVSHTLANGTTASIAILAVPILSEAKEAFAKQLRDLPQRAVVKPALRVRFGLEKQAIDRLFELDRDFNFKFLGPDY